jgi:hypothetical protein
MKLSVMAVSEGKKWKYNESVAMRNFKNIQPRYMGAHFTVIIYDLCIFYD